METLLEYFESMLEEQCSQEEYSKDYVEDRVNSMSQYEFLEALSCALSDMERGK